MNPWTETIGVVIIVLLSILVGRLFSVFKKPYWMFGYFFPCALIALLLMARFNSELCFVRPFSWIVAGRSRYVILSLAVSMGLTVPLSRLPRKWEKVVVCILMAGFVTWSSLLPFFVLDLI